MLYMQMQCTNRLIAHRLRCSSLAPAPLIWWWRYLLWCVWLCIGLHEQPTTPITDWVKPIRVPDSINVAITTPTAPADSLARVALCSSGSATSWGIAFDCRRRRRRRRRHGYRRVDGRVYGKHYCRDLDCDIATSVRHAYIQTKHHIND